MELSKLVHLYSNLQTLKKIQLISSNPCSEEWDEMRPDGVGRYCQSCEKHIVDLTAHSDAELIQFFKKKNDRVCGRLLATQLHRDLVLPPVKTSWNWLLPLAMGAILVSPAQASELKPVMEQNDTAFVPASVSAINQVKPSISPMTIRGSVMDERTGKPLKNVKIRQKGFWNVLALTDSAGKFELGISEAPGASEFTFELKGYAVSMAQVNDGIVIKLAAEMRIMLGMVATVSLSSEPMYVIYAGKKKCTIDGLRFKEIQPQWVEKIDILKDAAATALYGARAANGVILVSIKKAYAKHVSFSEEK